VSERPIAARLVRYQAQAGLRVVNVRHERVNLDEMSLYLLPYLDGTRSHDDLLDLLMNLVTEGVLRPKTADNSEETAVDRAQLAQELQSLLTWLAQAALLIG
jgi:methyltransferase-like protein